MRLFLKLWPVIAFAFFFFSCSMVEEAPIAVENIYLSIPDPHFETELIEQGIDSEGILDQQILKQDAEQLTRLDLNREQHFGEIADLTGIEGFVNLTFLSAVGHQIETVDLSANTKLDTLYLSGNYLAHMDISHQPNLEVLEILSNELTSITGLPEAISLKTLNLSFNYFEELSIPNPVLERLLITNNHLSSIDTRDALQLKSLLLASNQIESLDLSANLQLEILLISDNQLSTLDLEQNAELRYLYGSSIALTSIDVSNNLALIDLRIDRNPDLSCIQIAQGQEIPSVSMDAHQAFNEFCD